jgi:hemolysin activation/secretion protein
MKCLVSTIGCTAAFSVAPACADQVSGSQTDELARKPAAAKPAAPGMIQMDKGDAAAPPLMADSGASIPVSRFTFVGNTSQAEPTLAALVAPYTGRSLSLAELNEAADAVKRYYRAHGWFLAQAYIPAQTPRDGVVQIAVLEGYIDTVTINVAPDAPISQGYATRLAEAFLHPGKAITENGLEKPLLLLRDVPRVDAKSVIDPGSTVGTAGIVVNVVKDAEAAVISGRVELDNFGNYASGANRLGAEVNANNPFGLGDQISLRGFIANQHGNAFGRAGYTVPVGPLGTRVGGSIARLNYVLGSAFEAIRPNGIANVAALNLSHPLMRSKDHNLFAELAYEHKRLTDRIDVPPSSEEHTLDALRLQLNGDIRDSKAGVTLYTLGLTRGRLRIDDPVRLAFDQDAAAGAHTAGNFNKVAFSIERLQQLSPGLHAFVSVNGQRASKNLHPAEKLALGGDGSVRAFPVGEAVGDDGFVATGELRWAVPALQVKRLSTVATLFYDYGRVTLNHDNALVNAAPNRHQISGYGVGLNLGYADKVLVRLAVAKPNRSDLPDTGNKGVRVLAQASYSF